MNLKKYRIKEDLRQEDVANALNIKRATYANYENGKTEPTIQILIKLAEFFHISTDELLERKNLNIIDKGLLTNEQIKIIEISNQLNKENLIRLETYATSLIETQYNKALFTQRIKGE